MQTFRIELTVTVNTVEDVEALMVRESLDELLEEWDGGTVEITEVDELH